MIPAYDRTMVRRIFNQLQTSQNFNLWWPWLKKVLFAKISSYRRTLVRWWYGKNLDGIGLSMPLLLIQPRYKSEYIQFDIFPNLSFFGFIMVDGEYFLIKMIYVNYFITFFFPNKSQLTLEINWATTYLFTYVNMQGRKKWVGNCPLNFRRTEIKVWDISYNYSCHIRFSIYFLTTQIQTASYANDMDSMKILK